MFNYMGPPIGNPEYECYSCGERREARLHRDYNYWMEGTYWCWPCAKIADQLPWGNYEAEIRAGANKLLAADRARAARDGTRPLLGKKRVDAVVNRLAMDSTIVNARRDYAERHR